MTDTLTAPPTAAQLRSADQLIDWQLAASGVRRLVPGGPKVDVAQARAAVAELHDAAARATGLVAGVTGLHAVPGERVRVVDRAGWAEVNVESFRTILAPALAQALEKRRGPQIGLLPARKLTGTELGGVLALLSTKILGQFDIISDQLLLVAPNIVAAEQELDVPQGDFRLWVCLHEETHRVQFAANPWLREHLLSQIRELSTGLLGDPQAAMSRLVQSAKRLPELASGEDVTLVELIQTPEQRAQMAHLTAVMSLLEGHADVVMDAVGPDVIPSVEQIRARFNQRRKGGGAVDRLLRRLMGLDAKMRQYRDGAAFVNAVIDQVGMGGFNRVWTDESTLPLAEEILDPAAYLRRVH